MYLFLPALTPILALITCTQRNTSPYVVVSGVELILSDTFTVALYSEYFLGKDKENGYEEEMKLKDAGFSKTASNTF